MSPEDKEILATLMEDYRKAKEGYELQCAQMERWGKELAKLAEALVTTPEAIYGPIRSGEVITTVSGWRPTDNLPFVNLDILTSKSVMLREKRNERDGLRGRLERAGHPVD